MNAATALGPVVAAASWLLTYLLHSTLLLSAAYLLSRVVRGHAARESLWKAALLGGVLTATVQVVGGVHVLGGRWEVRALGAPAEAAPPASSVTDAVVEGSEEAAVSPASSASPTGETSPLATESAGETAAPVSPASPPSVPDASTLPTSEQGMGWPAAIVGVWVAVAAALLARLGLKHRRLHRMLRDRQPVTEGPLPALLAEMRRNAGIWHPVFLSSAPECPSPLALGTREICVPPRFLAELTGEEQRAALAHELAHVARRDPLWHLVAGVIEAAAFFQPLNRLARLRMREAAEFLADDWAVRQTGARMSLARCLAQVASWVSPVAEPIPTGTMAMAEGGSPLLLRVQRLLDEPRDAASGPPALRAAAVLALLAAVVAAAPAVTPRTATHEHEGEETASLSPDARLPTPETKAAGLPDDTVPRRVRVVRAPAEARTLEARWRWAHEAASRDRLRSYWVAYTTEGVIPAGTTSLADSGPWDMRELRATPLSTLLGVEAPRTGRDPLVVLLRAHRAPEGPEVDRVSVRSPGVGARIDGPVYFLGAVGTDESVAWLTAMTRTARSTDVRGTLYEAVGLHPGPRVLPILSAAARGDRSADVRRSAAEAVEWQASDEALALLEAVARTDGSEDVRRQAAESIGRLRHPRAPAVLRALMRDGRGEAVRTQALESLGTREDFADGAMLRDVALNDPDPALRRQATESLEQARPAVALRHLREIAWAARDPMVARQAAESLGNLRSRDALAVLDDIVARHGTEDAVVQAVEAISSFPDADALPRLRRIARTHPLERARQEALDLLSEDRRDRDADVDDEDPTAFDPAPSPGPSSVR